MKPKVIWLTGLPCSGKTTIANELKKTIQDTVLIDGDVIRKTISADLGFSMEDRTENMRRVAKHALKATENGHTAIVSVLSPLDTHRQLVKAIIGSEVIIMVYVSTPLEVCESRDVKGMYELARSGEIKWFTGVSSKYEEPLDADLVIDTTNETISESAKKILEILI